MLDFSECYLACIFANKWLVRFLFILLMVMEFTGISHILLENLSKNIHCSLFLLEQHWNVRQIRKKGHLRILSCPCKTQKIFFFHPTFALQKGHKNKFDPAFAWEKHPRKWAAFCQNFSFFLTRSSIFFCVKKVFRKNVRNASSFSPLGEELFLFLSFSLKTQGY